MAALLGTTTLLVLLVSQLEAGMPSKQVGISSATSCQCPRIPLEWQDSILSCNPESCTWSLQPSYWMGFDDASESNLLVAKCPPGYCNNTNEPLRIPLNVTNHELDRILCRGQNRTGLVCGACASDNGPAINSVSFECIYCPPEISRIYSAAYFLPTYLAVLALFLTIHFFRISLTSGSAIGFIMYAQIIASTFDISENVSIPVEEVVSNSTALLNSYRVIYNLFNLKVLGSYVPLLCLGVDVNTLTIISLMYVEGFFPVVIILFVVMVCKMRRWVGFGLATRACATARWPQLSLVPTFAAFLLLSCNRFGCIAPLLLGYQPLWNLNGTVVKYISYLDGRFSLRDDRYIYYYAFPAGAVLFIFTILVPTALLGYPVRWLERLLLVCCSAKARRFYPFATVHILLDVFQGCFKDNMRFFGGLYFFFRLGIYLSYAATRTWLQQYVVQQILVTAYGILVALCRPYKNELYNVVDTLLFVDLAAVNALTIYIMYVLESGNRDGDTKANARNAFYLRYVLVILPMFYMVSFLGYKACGRMRARLCGRSNFRTEDVDGESSDTTHGRIRR